MVTKTALKEKTLNKILQKKISVSKASRILNVSRKTVYSWTKKYRADLKYNQKLKTTRLRNSMQEVLRVVALLPGYGPGRISQELARRNIQLSRRSIWLLLKKHQLVYKFQRQEFAQKFQENRSNSFVKRHVRLLPEIRRKMIEEVLTSQKKTGHATDVYGISRKTFFKWKKRYLQATTTNGEVSMALVDRNVRGAAHPRSTPERIVAQVLDMITHEPLLSTHVISKKLGTVGNHGVQNIFTRYNLQTRVERGRYAKQEAAKARWVTAVIQSRLHTTSWLRTLTPNLLPAPPPLIRMIVHRLSAGLHQFLRRTSSFNLLGVIKSTISVPLDYISHCSWRRSTILAAFTLPLVVISLFWGFSQWISFLTASTSLMAGLGYVFSSLALLFGLLFFLYSVKYYLSIALVLTYSRHGPTENTKKKPFDFAISWLRRQSRPAQSGLIPDMSDIQLHRQPFVSIFLPIYNEHLVINRLLEAVTSMDYENYEVIVCDDSTDETKKLVFDWRNHPRVKISHRNERTGFKGGALREGLKQMDPQSEFLVVVDSDFIPYPDMVEQFLKYFKATIGSLDPATYRESRVAAVQGYQWHVLNKSENWITRGIRSEYAGSYVIERSGAEIYGGLKQIAGSVFMVRADLLRLPQYEWGNSITEDFELTLKLYRDGYKIVFTPYIQIPSECVSTIKRLIRQRMRWAEGHSHNVKKMFTSLMTSSRPTLTEKFEFLYLAPYYLQSGFFIVGTLLWFIAEILFHTRLPFWTEVWGWSLVLTNLLSLPLMNTVGLFFEEAEERDYIGLLSFIVLTYILSPFQAYAAVKGFLESEEGPWFRTPKTGHITDIFRRGRFHRWLAGVFPTGRPVLARVGATQSNSGGVSMAQYIRHLTFAALYERSRGVVDKTAFYSLVKTKKRKWRYLGKLMIVILLIGALMINYFAVQVPVTFAFGSDVTYSADNLTLNATRAGTCSGTSGNATLTCTSPDVSSFAANDWVLVIQMTGTGRGDFEERQIQSRDSATQVTFTANKTNTYTNDASSKAQMIKAEIGKVVTVNSGINISTGAWNGTTGGVLYYIADSFTVNSSGIVNVDGDGFSGGSGGSLGAGDTTAGGTGTAGGAGSSGSGDGGGGGGSVTTVAGGGTSASNGTQDGGGGGGSGGGGAGGSYGSAASNGSAGGAGANSGGGETGAKAGGVAGSAGAAGSTYGCADFTDATGTGCLFLGSGGGGAGGGGGGGDGDDNNGGGGSAGAAGGNGGGIVYIHANSLTNNGTIRANGAVGSNSSAATDGTGGGAGGGGGGGGRGASGGGGSGGSVWLAVNATSIGGTGSITSSGGAAGTAGAGGAGGSCGGPDPDGGGGGGGGSANASGGTTGCSNAFNNPPDSTGSGTVGSTGGDGRIKCDDSDGSSCTFSGSFSPSSGNTEVATAPVPEYALFAAPFVWFIPKVVERLRRRKIRKEEKVVARINVS